MSSDGQITYVNRYAHLAHDFDGDEHTEHECLPSHPAHEQAPIFINGKFTTVDIKLEWLIRTLCSHGFTTRYSCQGFKSLKKARKAGIGDDRGYIMFEGESVYEMLQRLVADGGGTGFLNEAQWQTWCMIGAALVTRDDHMIAPAQDGSRWAVEFVRETELPGSLPRFGRSYRNMGNGLGVKYNTVIRFPREDLENFRQIIEATFRNGVEL